MAKQMLKWGEDAGCWIKIGKEWPHEGAKGAKETD
jgi:hypothetical protein